MNGLLGILSIVVVAALVSCGPSKDQLRLQGCTDSIRESFNRRYGPCPDDQKEAFNKAVTNSCKDLLGLK